MLVELALYILVLIVGQAKPQTPWETWALSVEARLRDNDVAALGEHQKLRNEIDVLRQYVKALEVTQGKREEDNKPASDPATLLSNLPAIQAKTSDGKDIADADSVKEVLDAITSGKPIDWANVGAMAGTAFTGFLLTVGAGFLRHWSMEKKIDDKLDQAIAMPPRDMGPPPNASDPNSLAIPSPTGNDRG